jgi:hypothetical protein
MFEIDKEVPFPTKVKYPWNEMAIGDSFFVPHKKGKGNIYSLVHFHNRRNPETEFAVRRVDDGYRVWRLK